MSDAEKWPCVACGAGPGPESRAPPQGTSTFWLCSCFTSVCWQGFSQFNISHPGSLISSREEKVVWSRVSILAASVKSYIQLYTNNNKVNAYYGGYESLLPSLRVTTCCNVGIKAVHLIQSTSKNNNQIIFKHYNNLLCIWIEYCSQ